MRNSAVIGYLVSAALYFRVWWNPSLGSGPKLIKWVAFERLGLAEFLSCHAATLLAAVAMTSQEEATDPSLQRIFWGLIALYAVLGSGAYLFHRDHGVLLGFYLMLAIRALQLISMRNADVDAMRATVLKNFVMTFMMMLMVAGIAMSDNVLDTFARHQSSLWQKLVTGRPLIFVVVYYLLWALIEWKWPLRIAN
jgi:hypothetical protein